LGRSWSHLGAIFGDFEPSWRPLGASLGHLAPSSGYLLLISSCYRAIFGPPCQCLLHSRRDGSCPAVVSRGSARGAQPIINGLRAKHQGPSLKMSTAGQDSFPKGLKETGPGQKIESPSTYSTYESSGETGFIILAYLKTQ
jgi:hypothetical protein